MKSVIKILLIFILIPGCKNPNTKPAPKAVKGVLDLRSVGSVSEPSGPWDFSKDGIISLDGEWEFYWKEFRPPSFPPERGKGDYINVPGSWNNFLHDGKPLGSDGYASYRLRILLPPANEGQQPIHQYSHLSFKIPWQGTAYTMFVNGEKIASNGTVGKEKQTSNPQSLNVISLLQNPKDELEVIFHVSNFHYNSGGLWLPILAADENVLRELRDKNLFLDLFLAGSILIMGVYHFVVFYNRKQDKSSLLFGIYCLFIVIRIISTGEKFINLIYPELPYQLLIKLEYLSFYSAVPIFIHFLYFIFPVEIKKNILKFIWTVGILFSSAVILTPTEIFTYTLYPYQIFTIFCLIYILYSIGLALFNKRDDSGAILAGIAVLAVGVANDIFYNLGLISTGSIFSPSFLILIFIQSMILSRRFSKSFVEAEKLAIDLEQKSQRVEETTIELKQLTENLELKIQERTNELEKSNKEIDKLNKITKKINSVSDLTDILTFIMLHLEKDYKFNEFWMLLKEEVKSELSTFAFVSPAASNETISKMKNITVSLEELSLIQEAFQFQKVQQYFLDETDLNSFDRRLKEIHQFSYYLSLPFVIYEEAIGILLIHSKSIEKVSEEQLSKLQNFANQIAGAISNSRLFKQAQLAKETAEQEKEKALTAQEETEKQKRETEELNLLIKSLNEELDLKIIMRKVHDYIRENFGIQYYALYTVNKEKTYLSTLDIDLPEHLSKEDKETISKFQIPIKNVVGAHALTFKANRLFYLPKIKRTGISDEELFVIEKTKLQSFLMIPLILNNEPIGILDLSNSNHRMILTKDDLTRLSILGEQLAGIIHGSNLFKQVQEEKEKALVAQFEAVMAKLEIEKLNEFAKKINENFNLDEILNLIGNYIAENFNIGHYLLWRMDKDREYLYPYKGTFSENISKEDIKKFYNIRIPVSDKKGLHASVCRNRRVFFAKGMKRRKSGSEAENTINKLLGFESLLIVPLIIQNQVIGTMDFSHYSEKFDLTKEEIRRISFFCEQIAGVIHGASLLAEVERERQKSEKLLLNILPKDVASELKEKGFAEPVLFESVSVMFTDFKGFTSIAEQLTPQELIKDLDACFVQFDKISERYNLEKLKTIGDSYMCAGGIPRRNTTHAVDCVLAALEIQAFMNLMKQLKEEQGYPYWELRLGIHSGPLVAGVIGERKFAYDVWGDTVNTASRMESSGTPGKINISGPVHDFVKEFFECEYRGKVTAKNKGEVNMYYVHGLRGEYCKDMDGRTPNGRFWEKYGKL